MRLNPPTVIIFLISLILVGLALVSQLGFLAMPLMVTNQPFWLAVVAYLILMMGNIVKGL